MTRVLTCMSVAATHVGKVRETNEDNYLCDDVYHLYAVADGMGGHAAGEVASQIAVHALRVYARALGREPSTEGVLRTMFNAAHTLVLDAAFGVTGRAGMGTTLTACAIVGQTLHVAHAGDSACFLVRGAACERLTEEQADYHCLRNCVGFRRDAFLGAQYVSRDLLPGDVVLLTTDGLTDCVDDFTFIANVVTTTPFSDLANAFVRFALAKGGLDNVTVVAVKVQS